MGVLASIVRADPDIDQQAAIDPADDPALDADFGMADTLYDRPHDKLTA
jgi:hypothetical protein